MTVHRSSESGGLPDRPASKYIEPAIAIVSLVSTAGLVVFSYTADSVGTALKGIYGILAILIVMTHVSAYYARQRTAHVRAIENKLDAHLEARTVDGLKNELRRRFDPGLYELFPDHFDQILESVGDNLDSKAATLTRVGDYPHYYVNTLRRFPGANFCATSFLQDDYLWNSPQVDETLRSFLSSGGSMKRIFFTDTPNGNSIEPTLEAILQRQATLGVSVWTVPYSAISDQADLNVLMMADEACRISWTYDMADRRKILKVHATTERESIEKNIRIFRNLLLQSAIKKFPRDT